MTYRPATLVLDWAVLAGVAAFLAIVHYLAPPALQASLVFQPGTYTPLTLIGSAYVHFNDAHLLNNLAGYGLAAAYTHLLCLRAGGRRWFWLTTLVFLVALPVLASLSAVFLWHYYVGPLTLPARGFSGVVAGFCGFVLVALLVSLRRHRDWSLPVFVGLAILLVLLWEVLVVAAGRVPVEETALVAVGVALSLSVVGRRQLERGLPGNRAGWVAAGKTVAITLWTVVVLSVLVIGLFPANLVQDGAVVNIFGHAAGFGWGMLVSGWGFRYWGAHRPGSQG